jgi:hypothetical protein
MTKSGEKTVDADESMLGILESLLDRDIDIAAGAVARLHPFLKAAS